MLFEWDTSAPYVSTALLSDEQSESRTQTLLAEPVVASSPSVEFYEVSIGDRLDLHSELGVFADSTDASDELERKFLALAVLWKYGQGPSSSLRDMVSHPAYLQIIGLGRDALPFLFRELAREPDHWFSALSAITGQDPVPADANGNVALMTEAWLNWGRRHGQVI